MFEPGPAVQSFSEALADVVARAGAGVVGVRCAGSVSSGFVWRPGLIVTADEALADEGEISIAFAGGEAAATLVGRDASTDIALLRLERADLAPVTLESLPMRAGALALAVGSRGGAPVAALGAVAFVGGEWRSVRGGAIDARIELDVALRRHAEGGLAIDAAGRVFGMVVLGPRRRALVIPAATIERVAARLATHGRIPRGYLGLGMQPVRLDGDEGSGVMVMGVDARGPGAAAGVRQGDIIVEWNDQPIRDVRALVRALGPDSVGSTVRLSLRRGGGAVEISLTVGERPEA